MYLPGQIIHNYDTREPCQILDVWDVADYPTHHTHYLITQLDGELGLFTPRSLEQARCLLQAGIITPAPVDIHTHCWRCGNWHHNCRAFGCLEGRT